MKKFMAILVAVFTVFGAVSAFAADITVKVNDEVVNFDRQPYEEGGKVMLPYRFIAEKLGSTVAWDGETLTVFTLTQGDASTFQIGNGNIFVSGGTIALDKAPILVIDRTFVTEEVIETIFGADVTYDKDASLVTITK